MGSTLPAGAGAGGFFAPGITAGAATLGIPTMTGPPAGVLPGIPIGPGGATMGAPFDPTTITPPTTPEFVGPPTPTNIQPYVPPTTPEFVGPPTPTNIQPYVPPTTPEFVGPPTPTNIQPYVPPVVPPGNTNPITSLIDTAIKNPTIAGSVLGTVVTALDDKNKPTSTTTTSSIDPQMKAEYLANLERAKQTAAALEARQIAQPGAMYTGAEQQLYNLGMTPFGAADIEKFYNPYETQVVQGALGDIERTRLMQEQANRDRATAARAFGGSRQAIVSGMTNEAAMRQAANTAAQLRSAGYTQAANLGLQARPMDIAGLQTSLGLGTTRTALEQARLDALRNLGQERLAITSGALGLQPANVGGTTSQPLYSNTAGNLLSGGLTGAYIGSLFGKA
jgi:hypothetical protein